MSESSDNKHVQALKHIFDYVLKLDDDSKLRGALVHTEIKDILDLMSMTDDQINDLRYEGYYEGEEEKKVHLILVDMHSRNRIRILKDYIQHEFSKGTPIESKDWFNLSSQGFDDYRINRLILGPTIVAPPKNLVTGKPRDFLSEFQKGIKRDPNLFMTLKDEKQWDNFKRSTKAQVRSQGVSEVLDPNYTPSKPEEIALFKLKQEYMYAVAEKTLLTDIGKTAVRRQESTFDAQAVYKELFDQMDKSTKASLNSTNLLKYITSVKLGDGSWKGNTESFLLHWMDQVRLYNSMVDTTCELNEPILKVLMENVVHPIDELRHVKSQENQMKVQSGKDLTYVQYIGLLTSAMQQYDKSKATHSKYSMPNRHVNSHEVMDNMSDVGYGIDSDVDTILANVTKTDWPMLPKEIYSQLDIEAKQAWKKVPDAAKRIIMGMKGQGEKVKNPDLPVMGSKHNLKVNLHEMSAHDFIQNYLDDAPEETNASKEDEEEPDKSNEPDDKQEDEEHPLLAHLTDRSKLLTPTDIRRVLSTKVRDKNLKNKLGNTKKTLIAENHVTYSVSKHKVIQDLALVDRGANGNIGGSDVTLIELTNKVVNVQGIDEHEIHDIPIATVGGVTNTQHGEVIAIMHQTAYTGKGHSILAPCQLESFKNNVNEKSIKAGGTQRITTCDGYIHPIDIKNGLSYIALRPFTQKEWDNLPHVMWTSDVEWDPTVLDHNMSDTQDWIEDIQSPMENKFDVSSDWCRGLKIPYT